MIEENHGFNKYTLRLFITDKIKAALLNWTIGGVAVAIVIWLMEWGGEYFYIYVWGFVTVFLLIFMHVFHDLIAPLFNEFTPLKDKKLKSSIKELAGRIDFPLKKIYVVDGSKRSEHSNAYFFGFWKNKRIVIFDTLLSEEKSFAEAEILSILAHELGHWKCGHFIKRLAILEVIIFALFYLFGLVVYNEDVYHSFGFQDGNKFVGLILFSYLLTPAMFALMLALTKLSRSHEFEADDFAKKLEYHEELKSALVKIHTQNSGNVDPDSLYSTVHFSHPPLLERLENLGGVVGE